MGHPLPVAHQGQTADEEQIPAIACQIWIIQRIKFSLHDIHRAAQVMPQVVPDGAIQPE
jgi:hypothetical protein